VRGKKSKTQIAQPESLAGEMGKGQPIFPVDPAKFATETKPQNSLNVARIPLSLVPRDTRIGTIRTRFRSDPAEDLLDKDCLAERSGFELPVPLVTYRHRGLSASFVFSVGADRR
jgi:hypothetical protein